MTQSLTQRRARTEGGWTLIEMMVVVSLVMILAAIALPAYRNSIIQAKEAAMRTDLFMMRDAIDQYYADKGKYPDSLDTLVSENYMRAVPTDPFTKSSTTWQTTEADPTPGTLTATAGIYDVKSGADGVALDGSRYSDW
jgi:general secretion pathway protein G